MVKKIHKTLDDKKLDLRAKREAICVIISSDQAKLDEPAKKILMGFGLIVSPVPVVQQRRNWSEW
ncbi:MAG: hypothetical protein NTZ67_00110 [Gammaproteobacteria bacterium]|nr:hypothetical protein [Gammaproteobacteria bacterium]